MRFLSSAALAGVLLLAPVTASAVSFTFNCITNNLPGDCAIGEAQVMMDVTDPGGGQVRFTFTNVGPDVSTIARIYFDDGSLSSLVTIIDNPPLVDFMLGAAPPDLPGGNLASPPFIATLEFNTSATSPPPLNGVGIDAGEFVTLIFELLPAQTFADVLADMDSGALRAGVHVINFDSGGSESLVNGPEPATFALLALALSALATRRRRS